VSYDFLTNNSSDDPSRAWTGLTTLLNPEQQDMDANRTILVVRDLVEEA
jgi:hypothetical protein